MASAVESACYGMMIGDALAFPLHWYYSTDILKQHRDQYYNGSLTNFAAVHEELKHQHPDSGKPFSRVSAGLKEGQAHLLECIPERYREHWHVEHPHYHLTLQAGQNTNTTALARLLMESLVETGGEYDPRHYVEKYEAYFKSGNYNDLYLEGFHRKFFENKLAGKDVVDRGMPEETCLSGVTLILPLVLLYHKDPDRARDAITRHVNLSHTSEEMREQVLQVADLLLELLSGAEPEKTLSEAFASWTHGALDLQKILKDDDESHYWGPSDTRTFAIA